MIEVFFYKTHFFIILLNEKLHFLDLNIQQLYILMSFLSIFSCQDLFPNQDILPPLDHYASIYSLLLIENLSVRFLNYFVNFCLFLFSILFKGRFCYLNFWFKNVYLILNLNLISQIFKLLVYYIIT